MRRIKIRVKPKETRLDKFLATTSKSLSRSKAKKLIKTGFILVGERRVDPDYEIKRGDTIKIEIPPPPATKVSAQKLPLNIIYEDEDILVIDKEADMVVHPTLDHPSGTLVNALLYHLKKVPGIGETLRPGIVHRLDKGTSGLIVVAKNQKALEDLKSQFKKRTVVKGYLALVGGKLEPPVGVINEPISRHEKNRKKFTTTGGGKEAATNYKVLEYKKDLFTLVEAQPKTGRTHQIRVHFASIGHPLVGDKLYGGRAASRLFLHASYLEFAHPQTKKRIKFTSLLPGRLEGILGKVVD